MNFAPLPYRYTKAITSTEVTYFSKIYCHTKFSCASMLVVMLILLWPQNFTRSRRSYYY